MNVSLRHLVLLPLPPLVYKAQTASADESQPVSQPHREHRDCSSHPPSCQYLPAQSLEESWLMIITL